MSTQIDAVLDAGLQAEFARIIKDRLPTEACGVMLPTPFRGQRIWEMPNRSLKAQQSFRMESADVRMALGEWIESNPARLTEVTFWHSHPSGDSTPSGPDLNNRVAQACNLVIALGEDNELLFNWY